jgi:hypothetical protein
LVVVTVTAVTVVDGAVRVGLDCLVVGCRGVLSNLAADPSLRTPHPFPHAQHIQHIPSTKTNNQKVLRELAPYKNLVVSTGGGAVTQPANWGSMQGGIVAWLSGPPDLLARRVVAEGVEKRPLLYGGAGAAAGALNVVWFLCGLGGGAPALYLLLQTQHNLTQHKHNNKTHQTTQTKSKQTPPARTTLRTPS